MKSFLEAQMKYRPLSFEPRQARRPGNRLATWALIAIVGLLLSRVSAVPAFAQIVGTAQLNVERRGHTATLLEDAKVLIVGGDNQNGIVSQAEIFDPVSQTSALAATPVAARTDHTATRLSDGRVLVIGGRDQNSSLTSTEIYNPLTATFTAGPSLITPRSGHTATLLSDGKILVAGGDASGSAEVYNPARESFSLIAGSMNTVRKFHSAILTSSGQVLIVGGVNAQNVVLNTAEVFDPASQSFYLPPTDMQTPRALATLKLLADGKVQIIGGDAELSMEIFDPTNGIFIAKALLPPNADLLGASLSTQSRAALFSPVVAQDPLLQGAMTPEQAALLDRADHSITELPSRNQALVAGGINSAGQTLNSAKLVSSSSASISTDKTDYAPGQIVTITGSGFRPNEQVDIYFHEFPEEYPDVFLSTVADQQGYFVTSEFAPQEIDLGRVFTLTAIGETSGFTAQTAFKDARNLVLTFVGNGSVTITSSTGTVNAPISCGGTGTAASSQTVTSTCAPNITISDNGAVVTFNASAGSGSTFASWSGQANLTSSTCAGTTNPCSAVLGGGPALKVSFTATVATTLTISAPSPASVPFGSVGPVVLTATLTRTSGGAPVSGATVDFKVDASSLETAVTNGSGVATISTYNPSALSVGSHSVQASFAQQTISGSTYAASISGTQTLTVNQANTLSSVTSSINPSAYGQSVTFTATVTAVAPAVGIPTGAVQFKIDGVNFGAAKSLLSGSATSDATTSLAVGARSITAVYSGDTNFNATGSGSSTSPAFTHNVSKVDPTCTVNGFIGQYDGATHGATGSCTGVGGPSDVLAGLNLGSSFTNAPGGTANWTFTDVTGNYNDKSGSAAIVINKASSATVVSCPASVTYNGAAQTPCTAIVTGVGGLNEPLTVSYTNNVNAGTASASASFAGDANHNDSNDSKNFTIEKAATVTTVTCGAGPFIYNGNPHTPCSASVSGPGLNESLTVNYTNNVNAGTATASASYAESANYLGSTGTKDFTIEKAASVTTVTCPASINYNGSAQTPCSATATGAGSLNQSLTVSYSNNINAGIATANASFAGDTNHNGSSSSTTFTINKVDPTCAVNGFNGMYDSAAHGATGSCMGVGGASDVLAGMNLGSSFTNVPGGTANWTFTDVTGNYNNKIGSVNIVINQRPASVTPNAASKVYGDVDPAFSGALTNFLPADGVTATYSRTAGETVGNYTISATLSPTSVLGNYNITYNTANFTITYGVCLLFDNSKAVQKNSTIPIKLNLCGGNGVNVSSSAVVLVATNLVWSGSESAPEVQDSGNANPDDNFRFTGGSYMFNLSTKNLWSGKWGLEFRANGDPLSHVIIFNVR